MDQASDGSLVIATKYPKGCRTWQWAAYLTRKSHVTWGWRLASLAKRRSGQWHDYFRLPFGWTLIVSRQDFHKASAGDGGSQA
jgi:hypothetical protein